MTLSLVRPVRSTPATFCLRAFVASVRFARRWPEMESTYLRAAYGFLAERVRLETKR